MAENTEEQLKKFAEQLAVLNERAGAFDKAMSILYNKTTAYADSVSKGTKADTKKLNDALKVALTQRERETESLRRQYKERLMTEEEYTIRLNDINDSLKIASLDSSKFVKFMSDATISLEDAAAKVEFFINNKITKTTVAAVTTVIGNLTAAYNSSNTGLQAALSNASFTFKTIASAASGLVSVIPGAGAILGPIVQAVGDAGSKILDFMNKQVESISSSFKEASNAGAIFADGVSGLKNAAFAAGLTTDLFGKALSENRDAVILFGGSMTEGAKRIGSVSKFINPSQFQALGFGLEELPGLIANVGARMRRSGAATDEQVARATAQYAQNLRIIADLTGQDAKTLQAKADQDASDLAYQQYLATKTPEQRAAIENELRALPEASQQMFKEMVKSGGNVFTEQSAIIASQAPAFEKMARSLFNTAEQGAVQTGQGLGILEEYGTEARNQIQGLRDFGLAASTEGSAFAAQAETLAKSIALLNKTPEEIEKLRQSVAQAAITEDPTTKKLVEAEQLGMQNQIKVQQSVFDSLSAYLTVVNKLNDVTGLLASGMERLAKAVLGNGEQFDDYTKGIAQKAREDKQLSTERGVFGLGSSELEQAHAKLLTLTEAQIKNLAIVTDTSIDKILKTAGFADMQAFNVERARQQADIENRTDYTFVGPMLADGGIVSGPKSGFPATLHGNEAVVPLPDNINAEAFTDFVRASGTSAESQELVRTQQYAASQQNDLMQTLINKVDQLIDATKTVATYTERTAARVA